MDGCDVLQRGLSQRRGSPHPVVDNNIAVGDASEFVEFQQASKSRPQRFQRKAVRSATINQGFHEAWNLVRDQEVGRLNLLAIAILFDEISESLICRFGAVDKPWMVSSSRFLRSSADRSVKKYLGKKPLFLFLPIKWNTAQEFFECEAGPVFAR
jgi:hypothetical protein